MNPRIHECKNPIIQHLLCPSVALLTQGHTDVVSCSGPLWSYLDSEQQVERDITSRKMPFCYPLILQPTFPIGMRRETRGRARHFRGQDEGSATPAPKPTTKRVLKEALRAVRPGMTRGHQRSSLFIRAKLRKDRHDIAAGHGPHQSAPSSCSQPIRASRMHVRSTAARTAVTEYPMMAMGKQVRLPMDRA